MSRRLVYGGGYCALIGLFLTIVSPDSDQGIAHARRLNAEVDQTRGAAILVRLGVTAEAVVAAGLQAEDVEVMRQSLLEGELVDAFSVAEAEETAALASLSELQDRMRRRGISAEGVAARQAAASNLAAARADATEARAALLGVVATSLAPVASGDSIRMFTAYCSNAERAVTTDAYRVLELTNEQWAALERVDANQDVEARPLSPAEISVLAQATASGDVALAATRLSNTINLAAAEAALGMPPQEASGAGE